MAEINQSGQQQQQQQQQMPAQVTIQTTQTNVQANQQVVQQVPVQQTGTTTVKKPILRHTVELSQQRTIRMPDLRGMTDMMGKAQLDVPLSQSKKEKALKGCQERFEIQKVLSRNYSLIQQGRLQGKEITMKAAMKLKDKELAEGSYKGPKEYLSARYLILKNQYYTALPQDTMKKLARNELLRRLRELYRIKPVDRNKELIEYYQCLIRIKDLEAEANEKKKGNPGAAPKPETSAQKEENAKAFQKNRELLKASYLSTEEQQKHIKAMKKVIQPKPGDTFTGEGKIPVSEAQQEGIRQVLAWIYRNCNKSSVSKEGYAYRLTQAPAEKVLLTFYLVEKGKQASGSPADLYPAVAGYVPDISAIKNKMVASKWKFWKRIGSDSSDDVINWSLLGQASRFAMQTNGFDEMAEQMTSISTSEQKMEENKDKGPLEKRKALVLLLESKGSMLITLYRNAGLALDMPVEMIRDAATKQKVKDLLEDVNKHINDLKDLEKSLPKGADATKVKYKKKSADEEDDQEGEEEEQEGVAAYIEEAGEFLGNALVTDDALNVLGDASESIRGLSGYSLSVSLAFGIMGVVNTIVAIGNIVNLAKNNGLLTTAEHVSQAFDVSSALTGSVGWGVSGFNNLVDFFTEASEAATETGNIFADAVSTVPGVINMAASGLVMLGGIAQTVTGSIDLKKADKDSESLSKAKKGLMTLDQSKLTEDQKKLKGFLTHRQEINKLDQLSAGCKMISGVLSIATGFLNATGILAPLGGVVGVLSAVIDIGIGSLYVRKKKNQSRRDVVDSKLKLDEVVKKVKQEHPDAAIRSMDTDKLKNQIRQEMLADMGYCTYQELFAEICIENAEMLYNHVFGDQKNDPDAQIFKDTLMSLGLKYKEPAGAGDEPLPTKEMIISKLME